MKDPLFFNKAAGAVLTVALLFVGLPVLVNTFFGGGGHHGAGAHEGEVDETNPADLAYPIEFSLEASATEAAPEVDLGTLLAEASPEAGERAVAVCTACHTFEEGGANGTGPNLWGIMGRDIASESGFNYSGALAALEGEWTYEKMDPFLENSQSYVPGTQMAQRIGKDDKRADILAYLSTLTNGEPLPFPEPAPAPEEMADAGDAAAEGEGESAAAEGEGAPADEATAAAGDTLEGEATDVGEATPETTEPVTEAGEAAEAGAAHVDDQGETEAQPDVEEATQGDGETAQGEIDSSGELPDD